MLRASRLLSAFFLVPFVACVGDDAPTDAGGKDATNDITSDVATDAPGEASGDSGDGGVVYTYSPALSDKNKWEIFDSTPFSVANGNGGVFDGTYVYFVGSKILQYDPSKPFGDQASYQVFDPSTTAAPGVSGAVLIGKTIYFMPGGTNSTNHFLAYDTTKPFTQGTSWTTGQPFAPDAGSTNALVFSNGATDGKYLFAAAAGCCIAGTSAMLVRYDTTLPFATASSWLVRDMSTLTNGSHYNNTTAHGFDGRYLYMVHNGGRMTQYDTTAGSLGTGYVDFDLVQVNTSVYRMFGASFDSRYMYFAPDSPANGATNIALRYDTTKPFAITGSWDQIDLAQVDQTSGFAGATFDGRYMYFPPYWDPLIVPHGHAARYDTTKAFNDKNSWESYDLVAGLSARAKGFRGAVFDGRHVYFVTGDQNLFVRFDAKSPSAVPKPTASFF